ncbi:MAG TPA: argininosuccinate lyase [Syntrophales bacterium]|nr:argininosuccinate lyase [Syntrophales bacterium]HOL58572.1 argininosuccinate lyase [Syntrophales bacterium]HPO34820.1 argininosuccinate lyase [Syntrophales bacterium]
MKSKTEKPWGGRFREATDPEVERFTASIPFDRRLYRQDIEGSVAHARMLCRQGIISREEEEAIVQGLKEIGREIEAGKFAFKPEDEDIHMAIEKALIKKIGSAGEKLHTGRSRNDQVALDMRLYVRGEMERTIGLVRDLRLKLVEIAEREKDTIMPGYTHLQKAQPVLLAHYLLAFEAMFARDEERLRDAWERVNVMPLGAGALAGSGLPLDRKYVAELLDFPRITQNSMDTVSDRDFVAEYIFACALIMMHLSRICEDFIIWSTSEFSYLEIADSFATGSSLMPQKKNPDVAELIRGKTGRVYGHLISLLTVLKGLPMTYNRDLQEDKEALFDAVDTTLSSLQVFIAMLGHIKFNREKMAEEAAKGFTTATDLVEYLVLKGLPFREAHGVVGKLVAYCLKENRSFADLSLQEWKKVSEKFGPEIKKMLTPRASIERKKTLGSTSFREVEKQIARLKGRKG